MQKSPIVDPGENENSFYIPHHAVFKEKKIRVVFNGSSTAHGSASLNNCLHIGPALQSNLIFVLCRWRFFQFVFTADIEKMYRQILIHPADRKYQRILWRSNLSLPITSYDLNTVTYGVTSSAYQAIRSLKELSKLSTKKYPTASKVINENMYVDDALFGADTLKNAINLSRELTNLLQSGGFPLRKWNANFSEMLNHIPKDWRSDKIKNLSEHDNIQKLLGLTWSAESDEFTFVNTIIPVTNTISKRYVLSSISKIFDPLGLISPVIIKCKIFMQSLWQIKLQWDDELPVTAEREWSSLYKELRDVNKIKIPRWLSVHKNADFEIHGFSDASTKAMSVCIYLRVFNESSCNVNLLIAKTKLAPLKTLTIPRLELCAAYMLAKLLNSIASELDISEKIIHLWTDSTIVLSWLNSSPHLWNTFVSHRIAEIQRLVPTAIWHHIEGECNPADLGTRGITISDLIDSNLWWHGPTFLQSTYRQFQVEPIENIPLNQCPEFRKINTHNITVKPPFELVDKYSSLTKLVRITAWCFRFFYNCKLIKYNSPIFKKPYLIIRELRNAEVAWVRYAQNLAFPEELKNLIVGNHIPKNSRIIKLSPYLDSNTQVLRVGGRLKNSSMSENQKHPMILPANSCITNLIISHHHLNITLHGTTQLTLASIRNSYWIINGRRTISHNIPRCHTCIRHKGQTVNQIMGNLPAARVNISMPFQHTGVDFAGPIKVRTSAVRGQKSTKGYICVFVCFVTKAIHLEAVSGLDTNHFLMAFKRFISRRGLCSDVYSDQGTNFVGASNELMKLFSDVEFNTTIANNLANMHIQWHFNPPSAPHFGGLWEAAVKSAKGHLVRVIGESTLTFEELSTLLSCIEACLNSRPLIKMTDDSEDLPILTPAHFLIGRSLISLPESDCSNEKIPLIQRWKLVNQMRDDFWKTWRQDYLNQLQQKVKWYNPHQNIKVRDIVLIKSEQTPPTQWPLARVLRTHAGEDDCVRVVTVETSTSILQRPVHKLILLPVD